MLRDRKHIRLRNFDYASEGWYFVTICTQNREFYFGEIANQEMVYTGIGEIARQLWTEIPAHFPMAELGEFVVMPNHVHGIIGIHHRRDVACRTDVACNIPTTKNQYMASISPKPGTLSAMIRSYKSAVTKNFKFWLAIAVSRSHYPQSGGIRPDRTVYHGKHSELGDR